MRKSRSNPQKTTTNHIAPKICLTAGGCLIHQDQVLLVKHKKVKTWLNPGGHVESNEAPHQAAEREFWEETGVRVKAFDLSQLVATDGSQYLPSPYVTNLHWVCRDNYQARVDGQPPSAQAQRVWPRGCEQHLNFMYLVEPEAGVDFQENVEEVDGISWFSPAELASLDLYGNVDQEIKLAFELIKNRK